MTASAVLSSMHYLSSGQEAMEIVVPSGITWNSSDQNIHVFTVESNGMRIVWAPIMQGQKCVIHRIIQSGSQLEDYSNLGGTHALEHFMFKDGYAWKTFGGGGANLNAYTSHKVLATTADISVSQLPDWLAYQGDCMRGLHLQNLDAGMISSEINNVLDEMHRNQGSGNTARHILNAIQQQCLPQGNPLPTIGVEATLNNITTAADIVSLQRALLGPSRNTLMIVGQWEPTDLLNTIDNVFSDIPRNEGLAPLPLPRLPEAKGMRVLEMRQNSGATAIGLGWPCPAYNKDCDVLLTIADILNPPQGVDSPIKPYTSAGAIYEAAMFVTLSNTPDVTAMILSIPCSKQSEPMAMAKAQMCVQHLLGAVLPNFDNNKMLNASLARLRLKHHNATTGNATDIANALSEGIAAGSPSLNWHADERFAEGAITTADICRVSKGLMGETSLCMIKYMQNTIAPMGDFSLNSSFGYAIPRELSFSMDRSSNAPFSNKYFHRIGCGHIFTRRIAPITRSTLMYAFKGIGSTGHWGGSNVLCKLMSNHSASAKELADLHLTLKWAPTSDHIVAVMQGPSVNIAKGAPIVGRVMREKFGEDKLNLVKMQVIALVNGMRYNADLVSKMQYINRTYHHKDPCYILPFGERLKQTSSIDAGGLASLQSKLLECQVTMGCANMSTEQMQEASKICGTISVDDISPVGVTSYSPSYKTKAMENNPSCKVTIAQPCIGLSKDNAAGLAHMKLACHVLGNGFSGKLMQQIRDARGYTYNITCECWNRGSTPSVLVGASFKPSVLQPAIKETMEILDNWAEAGLSEAEFSAAKTSLMSKINLLGLDRGYVNARLLRELTTRAVITESDVWENLSTCTLQDVNRSLRKYTRSGGFSTSVAGSVAS